MVPLLPPLLALIAGILLSPCLDSNAVWLVLPFAILISVIRSRYALLPVVLLGAGLRSCEPAVPPDPADTAGRLTGTLLKSPEWRGLGVYLDVEVLSIDGTASHGKARLTEFLDDPKLHKLFETLGLAAGDRLEILVKLRRPAVYRNPGVFDFRRALERQHVYWTGTIRNPRLIQVLESGSSRSLWWSIRRTFDRARNWAQRKLSKTFQSNRTTEGIVMAMVLGRTYGLTAATERQFQTGGVYHLLVVSGFNLVVVTGAVSWCVGRVRLKRQTRFAVVLGLALLYGSIVEGQTPVLRAALMVCFLVAGRMLDRGYSPLNSAAGTALVILVADPAALETSSFQMTFAAVFTLIGLGVPATQWAFRFLDQALIAFEDPLRDPDLPIEVAEWRVVRRLWCERYALPYWTVTFAWKVLRFFGEAAIVSFSVETVFIFFMVESFHRLAPLSPLLNIPAGLIAAIVTPLGLATLILPGVIAAPVAFAVNHVLTILVTLLDVATGLPMASLRVPSPPFWVWFFYAGAVAAIAQAVHGRRFAILTVGTVVVLFIHLWIAEGDFAPRPPAAATLTFLDVGQGDSTLIELPNGERILIDGGGIAAGRFLGLRDESSFSIGEAVVSSYLFSRGVRRLDTVVLTHAHNDHLDGLFDVIENFEIGEFWLGRNPMIPAYKRLIEELQARSIPIRWVSAGHRIGPFTVLHPPANWKPRRAAQNDDSVVLLLESGGHTALLTGDLERLNSAPDTVDVLKVPHHGSKGARLRTRAPVRIISVGANNPFGHPDLSTLPALRTDRLGAITVTMTAGGPRVASALTNSCPPCKLALLLQSH